MCQEHRAGDKVFLDYSDGLSVVDAASGELTEMQLFVAVWGASNYICAEASLTQTLPSWIGSHVRAFAYFGCVPRLLVPDNLKSGVYHACLYEPEENPTYAEMAQHYGCAVLPACPVRPRDKACVELVVLVAKRWLLAVLQRGTFNSLAEMNAAIGEWMSGRPTSYDLADSADYQIVVAGTLLTITAPVGILDDRSMTVPLLDKDGRTGDDEEANIVELGVEEGFNA